MFFFQILKQQQKFYGWYRENQTLKSLQFMDYSDWHASDLLWLHQPCRGARQKNPKPLAVSNTFLHRVKRPRPQLFHIWINLIRNEINPSIHRLTIPKQQKRGFKWSKTNNARWILHFESVKFKRFSKWSTAIVCGIPKILSREFKVSG